jgi:RNA recognition motif-containing protein
MQAHFEKFGPVQDSILMVDRISGRSRCFGFITMQDAESLDIILAQEQIMDGKRVDCKRAVPRDQNAATVPPLAQSYKTKKMFVGGLPPDVTDEMFRSFFEQFGGVEDSVVMLDRDTGRPRGFGFITFQSEDTADKVLENFDKNYINGKWVECKKATPRQVQSLGAYQNYTMPYMMMPQYYPQNYFYDYFPQQDFAPQTNYVQPQEYTPDTQTTNIYEQLLSEEEPRLFARGRGRAFN